MRFHKLQWKDRESQDGVSTKRVDVVWGQISSVLTCPHLIAERRPPGVRLALLNHACHQLAGDQTPVFVRTKNWHHLGMP